MIIIFGSFVITAISPNPYVIPHTLFPSYFSIVFNDSITASLFLVPSAKIIGKYEGRGAWNIANGLGSIAESTKDKDAVIESAKIIGKYEEEGAENIAYGLGDI